MPGTASTIATLVLILLILIIIFVIGYLIYYEATSANKKAGEACNADKECANKDCAYETAADDAHKICCPSGNHDFNNDVYYCTGMPNGSVCTSDVQCKGGRCEGDLGGLRGGICYGNGVAGDACVADADCKNDFCARLDGNDTTLHCCADGYVYDALSAHYFCKNMPDGNNCRQDDMCKSGLCKNGVCIEKLLAGGNCDSNSECVSDACAYAQRAAANTTCCTGTRSYGYGNYYCDNMPTGNLCWSNSECASGYCNSDYVCEDKQGPGMACTADAECSTGACAYLQRADTAYHCCPSGHWATYAANPYCTQMPNGNLCWSNAQCASGHCDGTTFACAP